MNDNVGINIGNGLASRIEKQLSAATNDALNFQDRSVRNVRAGWQQRYGSRHTEDLNSSNFAQFGSVWGSSSTVGP